MSLPWARLCLWSWRLAQACCYVGFYGGKKKHRDCQTWVSIKKGEEGSGEGGEGSLGWRKNVILWCSKGETLISAPIFELYVVGLTSQAHKVKLKCIFN